MHPIQFDLNSQRGIRERESRQAKERADSYREKIRQDYTIIPHQGDVKISYSQAIANAKILLQDVTLKANDKGELSYLSNFNLVGRVIQWVKGLVSSSTTDRVAMAVRATFKAIHDHNQIRSGLLSSRRHLGWDSTNRADGWYFPLEKKDQTLFYSFDDLYSIATRNGHLQGAICTDEDRKVFEQVNQWANQQKYLHGLSLSKGLFKLTFEQARNNAKVLHDPDNILTVDEKGNLDSISWFNIPGRLIYWLKTLIKGSQEFKVHKAVLATFQIAYRHGENSAYVINEGQESIAIPFSELSDKVRNDKRIFADGYLTPVNLSQNGYLKEAAVLQAIRG